MIRFLGNIEVRADAKGRVFIPATFRKQLQAASEERLIMRRRISGLPDTVPRERVERGAE